MRSVLARLIEWDAWANELMRPAVFSGSAPARAVELLCHIVAVHHLFQSRIRGEKPPQVWPRMSDDEVAKSIAAARDGWLTMLRDSSFDLDRRVNYVNSKGEAWENSPVEMISHTVTHSAYHRGQIAMLLGNVSAAGGAAIEVPYTDFIEAARRGVV